MRYAIAYTPPPESPLARFGAGILGYDCFEAAEVPRRAVDGIDPAILLLLTIEPRRYGFNACLVSPFSLEHGSEAGLRAGVESFAKRHVAILVGPLGVACVDEFIVLRANPDARLNEFAAACRTAFNPPGREPNAADRPIARANTDASYLSMPLLGPVPKETAPDLAKHLAHAFSRLAGDHVEVGSISLMRQDNPADRFRVLLSTRLTGR